MYSLDRNLDRRLGHYSRSGDIIHPQLRCGSGYETRTESITCAENRADAAVPTVQCSINDCIVI